MKIAISNIAWEKKYNSKVFKLLKKYSINIIEAAPTLLFSDILKVKNEDVLKVKNDIEKQGLQVKAFQSLLYKKEWNIFKSEVDRNNILSYLKKIFYIGNILKINVVVFGSPKNRKKLKESKETFHISENFFIKLANLGSKYNIKIALEPNPKEYGCNFLTSTLEAYNFVKRLNHPFLGINLDLGTIILNKTDIKQILNSAKDKIYHIHISAPYLQPIYIIDKNIIQTLFKEIKKNEYDKITSIEMKKTSSEMEDIEKSIKYISELK